MRELLLAVHIASGAAGLLLGPLSMWARKRPGRGRRHWHRQLGLAYQVAVVGLCASALGLVAVNPSVWWLGVIGIATEAAAVTGWVTRPSRRPDLVAVHVGTMCGSYVSFATAFLVVNSGSLVWWILPTLVGSPLIAWTSRRAVAQYGAKRPPSRADTSPAANARVPGPVSRG
ncbi:MAG: hypothetical protein ACRDQA_08750 [Nocardioidaceae bacterium]